MIIYRVMVTGEDGMLFCYQDDLKEQQIPEITEEAKEDYPCGHVFVESYDPIAEMNSKKKRRIR